MDRNSMAELCSHFTHRTMEVVRKLQPGLSAFTFNGLCGDEWDMEPLLHYSVLQLRDGCSQWRSEVLTCKWMQRSCCSSVSSPLPLPIVTAPAIICLLAVSYLHSSNELFPVYPAGNYCTSRGRRKLHTTGLFTKLSIFSPVQKWKAQPQLSIISLYHTLAWLSPCKNLGTTLLCNILLCQNNSNQLQNKYLKH